jgi:hypothetical protein
LPNDSNVQRENVCSLWQKARASCYLFLEGLMNREQAKRVVAALKDAYNGGMIPETAFAACYNKGIIERFANGEILLLDGDVRLTPDFSSRVSNYSFKPKQPLIDGKAAIKNGAWGMEFEFSRNKMTWFVGELRGVCTESDVGRVFHVYEGDNEGFNSYNYCRARFDQKIPEEWILKDESI